MEQTGITSYESGILTSLCTWDDYSGLYDWKQLSKTKFSILEDLQTRGLIVRASFKRAIEDEWGVSVWRITDEGVRTLRNAREALERELDTDSEA